MRNGLEYFRTQPFPELNDPFLMTGRAEVPPLAGKGQQVFMAAVLAADSRKTLVKIAAVQKAQHYLFDVRPKIPVWPLIKIVPVSLQVFPVGGYAAKIVAGCLVSGLVYSGESQLRPDNGRSCRKHHVNR